MNDPTQPFVLPAPDAPWWRRQARALRRAALRRRLRAARGEDLKRLNAALNWREFWHGLTVLESRPRLVQVGTNWTCNLHCAFCRLTMPWTQAEMKKKSGRELTLSPRVEAVVERLLPTAELLTLTPLGEPLLWSGLKDLLALHARLGSRNLALTSNGMLLSDEMAERLVRGELRHLFLSIDTNDPAVYAAMRVGGDLAQVEAGVRRVVEWKRRLGVPWPRLTVNATFMRRNIPQLPSMVGWAARLGFDELSVQLMEIENPEMEEEFLGHDPTLAQAIVARAMEEGRRLGFQVTPHAALRNLIEAAVAGHGVDDHAYQAASPAMPESAKRPRHPAPTAAPEASGKEVEEGTNGSHASHSFSSVRLLVEKCHYPWYNLLIDTDGDARPCCWADLSWGNLNALEFGEVWNGPGARRMREQFLADRIPPACRGKHCRVDL
ncbi:MAG: radical SAM protein [bacterium]|nr:radical SAM protein [bacterium]